MLPLVKDLHATLQAKLKAVDLHANTTKQYKAKSEIVEAAIIELKQHLVLHPFPDKATEIEYFKSWLPSFTKLHVFYLALSELELIRKTSSKEEFLKHLQNEKKRITHFFKEHRDLYHYYLAEKINEDEKLFVRDSLSGKRDFLEKDSNFCHHSLLLGWLLAYEEYVSVLDKEIEAHIGAEEPEDELELVTTDAENAELLSGLLVTGLLRRKGAPATIAEGVAWMKRRLNIEIKNFSVVDYKNRNRKKSTTPLLQKMIDALNARAERLDP